MPEGLKSAFQRFYGGIMDTLYPRNCLMSEQRCREKDHGFSYLAKAQVHYLREIDSPYCECCGFPLYGMAQDSSSCQKCEHLEPKFSGNRSAIIMNGLGRRLIHAFKYERGFYLQRDIATIFQRMEGIHTLLQNAVIVPVPLHPRKYRERSYNQTLLLAKILADLEPSAQVREMLVRDKDTLTQTKMDRSERIKNMAKAFKLKPGVSVAKEAKLLICDDVFTTGSTVNECAKTLRKAGYSDIRVITLGHG